MKAKIDCYPCIFSQVARLAKLVSNDEDVQYEIIQKLISIVSTAPRNTTPPEFAGYFHKLINEFSHVKDPFLKEKDKSTQLGLLIYEDMKNKINDFPDPFEAIVRLVIGGNIIDFGANPNFQLSDAEEQIMEVFDLPFDTKTCKELKQEMDKAKSIFYILDNCGEAVLDRLLIEPYMNKITIGVRGFPILNDITRRELELSGIKASRIIDTGDIVPGVSLKSSSKEFLEAMYASDLVITKGQGNYETLDEYERPIFHLLRVKCEIISEKLNSPMRSMQIIKRNFN